jgi:hypothetical protein
MGRGVKNRARKLDIYAAKGLKGGLTDVQKHVPTYPDFGVVVD